MIILSKYASFRLTHWKGVGADQYWEWCKSHRREGYEWHHLLKRQHGHLLVVQIPADVHKKIHSIGYTDGQYEDLFVQAIETLITYIEHLQKEKK